ncbi:MAG: elongation factor EF-2 [Nanoarchaeota archaeon]|nr:elongation factor EF-2 [Nanoarchaeota archaeon]MBU4086450.1 elongation factor EF-2 [Nanoarchaeota archaeon]
MVEKETSLEKIKRICSNQKNIRNIATSAHIHHGKCISGESRILMAEGGIRTAREIFEDVSENGNLVQENEEHTVFSPGKKVEIFSLNKDTGRIEKKEVQHAWRLVGGKTIKIKLRNGFCIETTPEHKYLISKDGEFAEIEAKGIKLGDRIVCPRKLEINASLKIKEEILERLSNENFYIHLKSEFHELLKKKILQHGIETLKKNIGISVKTKSFYHGIWQNRYNLKDFVSICKLFGADLEKAYDEIGLIFYRTGKQRGQNSLKMKLPQNFEELFYLAGLFLGDGSGNKFIVGKEELGEKLINICKELGINPIKTQWKEKTPEVHTNMTLEYVLHCLFGYPLKQKSHNVRISDFVFKSENKLVARLLRGYFDTDGCVENSRRAVTISSVSSKMIDDLHLLLLRFGIVSIKEVDNTISISGMSAINFQKNIGFFMAEKAEKLESLVKKVSGSTVCDTIKINNQVMMINRHLGIKTCEELAFIDVKSIEESFQDVVYDFTIPENHNFISEGMIIHNTALTDNLLAASGYMATKNAGDLDAGMATWQHSDEQERLLTVDSANVSMVHKFGDEEFLVNLIDTPGHVDFGGNVTRAMRAIDGTIVLVCASEGIMPQTETVLKQALRERVRPVLFINKVDRLIKELKLTPEGMQERFMKIFREFNDLISKIAEKEYKDKWLVDINDGSVAFGSARDNWALSIPFMKKKGISFKDILKLYSLEEEERKEWCWKNAPLYEVLLDMVVKHLPSPLEAQKYRIPKIWHGDIESEFGKNLMTCNPQGKPAFVITRIVIEPKSGKEIAAGRLFSGTFVPGQEVYLNLAKKKERIQQVLIYNGIKPEQLESIGAGNVIAISGITGEAGETVTVEPEQPFEELKHIFEPVITKAIEVKKPSDLPKLIEVLRKVAKEDPSVRIEINEETGENLMSGMGELHLEIIENRIKTEKGVDVKTSAPIVVFRETAPKKSAVEGGRSPNKHNDFFIQVEPLEESVYLAIKNGDISGGRIKKRDENLIKKLRDLGVDNDEIRQYRDVYKGNVFLDTTKGEVHMTEVIELILDAFEQVVDAGPLAREPCMKMKVSLSDVKLHEDAIHRGPAQVYPAVRDALYLAMKSGGGTLFEPIQTYLIEAPTEFLSALTKLVSGKRGQLLEVRQEDSGTTIKAKIPVAEMIGWSSDLRSATEGRGVSSLSDQSFEQMPKELQIEAIKKIRERKGLAENQ